MAYYTNRFTLYAQISVSNSGITRMYNLLLQKRKAVFKRLMYDMNKKLMLLKELVIWIVSAKNFKISTVMAIYNHVKNHNRTTTMILVIMFPHSTRK
jgi:hypothetical protein